MANLFAQAICIGKTLFIAQKGHHMHLNRLIIQIGQGVEQMHLNNWFGLTIRAGKGWAHPDVGHARLRQAPQTGADGKAAPDFFGLGKIAALGIKVSRNCTYHGAALNVAMDLTPFSCINPCGYSALQTEDLSTIGVNVSSTDVAEVLANKLITHLAP